MQVGPLRLKLQFVSGETIAFGPGKADLLAAIAAEGSISGAARAMGMSYRRAWLLVDEMNRCFAERLVETLAGGGRERGARLTGTGQAALAAYRALEEQAGRLAEAEPFARLASLVRASPRDPAPPASG